jgi:pyrroline-5-carboxylate reductase
MVHIALLGTGSMGRAIIDGLTKNNPSVAVTAFDTFPPALESLPKRVTIAPPEKWFSKKGSPDAVVFAVKPADLSAACKQVFTCQKQFSTAQPLWISIAAGISIDSIKEATGNDQRICRVMPNTPAKVGEGMSAYACSTSCTNADRAIVEQIFSACGKVRAVPEKLLHAITGLSGSGPAYVFLFIEALIEGGVTAGLPLATARECAVQTVLGAAKMVQESKEHTGALKTSVMSPGGTTAAGLHVLEKNAFKNGVIEAISAATMRSAQLGA